MNPCTTHSAEYETALKRIADIADEEGYEAVIRQEYCIGCGGGR